MGVTGKKRTEQERDYTTFGAKGQTMPKWTMQVAQKPLNYLKI